MLALFNDFFIIARHKMAEEGGIQPPVALTDSRQFSGLVTFATRPLLRMERRRGFEPRTPGLQPGRSPLAVAARKSGGEGGARIHVYGFSDRCYTVSATSPWRPGGDSNTRSRVWNPLASPSATGTYWCAQPLPQLDYGRKVGRLGRIRTDTGRGLSALPLPGWATSLWCSGRDSNSQQCGSQPHASTKLRHPNIGGQSRI